MGTTIIIGLVAFGASMLTFFSGFGLGTLLTPVFLLFFPVEIAIAMTAVVHFLNNVFKFGLTYKDIDWKIALLFSSTAVVASFIGAWVLTLLSDGTIIYSLHSFGEVREVSYLKFMLAILMVFFVVIELHPRLSKITFSKSSIPIGGLLSGFFGGLAGFQGVLRSMFLLKSGLTKQGYIATGIFIACVIDIARLTTYYKSFDLSKILDHLDVLSVGVICAFAGAFIGAKLIEKVTLLSIHYFVSFLLVLMSIALFLGLL